VKLAPSGSIVESNTLESGGVDDAVRAAASVRTQNRKGAMKGFKDFIMRGNLVELAVAFILGAAFGDVVKSFTAIIMDLIGKLGGTPNFSSFQPGGVHVGTFITAVVSFLILAFVIYFGLVKPFEYAKSHLVSDDPDDVPPTTEELLADIRDILAKDDAPAGGASSPAHKAE